MTTLETERLRLVPATVALVDADLGGTLGATLGVAVPPDWPPEHHDEPTLRWTRDALAEPANAGWLMHYIVWSAEPVVVGFCGYTGAPDPDGAVEIGYSVVPSFHRRGIATEAAGALVSAAFARGARTVTAKTLPDLVASIGVLENLGFSPIEPPEPGVIAFALSRG